VGNLRQKIAKWLVPDRMSADQVQALVDEKVQEARMARPWSLDVDPHNDGYRRLSDGQTQERRDLSPMNQDLMLSLAYYLYDTSGLVKRFVRDTKNFILGEGISYRVDNDERGDAKSILDEFWNDSINLMPMRLEKRIEFLGLLGEQCWAATVNPHNGRVWLSYIDPENIATVVPVKNFAEMAGEVRLQNAGGLSSGRFSVVREELDPRNKHYGRLTGECFFFAINNPPNGSRGRSDMIHLFDFINGFEEGLFDELDRLKFIKSFIWDVSLDGASEEDIKDFLDKNKKPPKSGSLRAHNERVTWTAVAPDLKMADNKNFFDLMKTYLAASMNRPDSWLGSGGKAYQTEADLMGEPTFKDLGSRQRYVKYMLEYVLKFVLDQAIIHGRLKETEKKPYKITVEMPEMSIKDVKKTVDGLFTLAQSLMIAETQGWVTTETAATIYASVATNTGVEISAAEEIKNTAKSLKDQGGEDYRAREALISEIAARIERNHDQA